MPEWIVEVVEINAIIQHNIFIDTGLKKNGNWKTLYVGK